MITKSELFLWKAIYRGVMMIAEGIRIYLERHSGAVRDDIG